MNLVGRIRENKGQVARASIGICGVALIVVAVLLSAGIITTRTVPSVEAETNEFTSGIKAADSLQFEEVQPDFPDDENIYFHASYVDMSIDAERVFVPDVLENHVSDFSYWLESWDNGDNAHAGYTLQYKGVYEGVEYPTENLNALLGNDSDADSTYPANYHQIDDYTTFELENSERIVFDFGLVENEKDFDVWWEVEVSSHYEHLILDYELWFDNDSVEPHVVETFQDVYSDNRPSLLPIENAKISKHLVEGSHYDRLNMKLDHRFRESENLDVTIAYSDNSVLFENAGVPALANFEYAEDRYDNVVQSVNESGDNDALAGESSGLVFRSFELSVRGNEVNNLSYYVSSSENVTKEMYIWVEGSYGGVSGVSPSEITGGDKRYTSSVFGDENVGFNDLNVDVRSANPSMNLNKWEDEIDLSIELDVENMPYDKKSVFSLGEMERNISVPDYLGDYDENVPSYRQDYGGFSTRFYPMENRTITWTPDGLENERTLSQLNQNGFEFETVIKESLEGNKIRYKINGYENLEFYYQPALHENHSTWADEDNDGNPDSFRPPNVVGSYAVYHANKGNMHPSESEAEKYKTGKAFHIYRPRLVDNAGNETYADLSIDETAGTLTITVDRTWLNQASYPVRIDPTFGYETVGSSNAALCKQTTYGGVWYTTGSYFSVGEYFTPDSISYYINSVPYSAETKAALADHSDDSLLEVSESALSDSTGWETRNISGASQYSSGDYWLVGLGDANDIPSTSGDDKYGPNMVFDSGSTDQGTQKDTGDYNFDDPIAKDLADVEISIYCTYSLPNEPPNAPTNPTPADGLKILNTSSTTLSVDVSDPDGDSMDVTFYDNSDDSSIATDTGVADGGTASVTWSGLSGGNSYDWYAIADDGSATTQSSTWIFSVNDPPTVENIYTSDPIDPETAYDYRVEVRDNDNLADVDEVYLRLYDNSLAYDSADDERDHYSFKWVRGSGFSEVGLSGHLNVASCSAGNDSNTIDNWVFNITLNTIANPDPDWNAWTKAVDNSDAQDNREFVNEFSVNVYTSYSIDDSSITFSGDAGDSNVASSGNPTTVTVDSNVSFDVRGKVDGAMDNDSTSDTIPMSGMTAENSTGASFDIDNTAYYTFYGGVPYGEGVTKDVNYFLDIPAGIESHVYTNNYILEVVQS